MAIYINSFYLKNKSRNSLTCEGNFNIIPLANTPPVTPFISIGTEYYVDFLPSTIEIYLDGILKDTLFLNSSILSSTIFYTELNIYRQHYLVEVILNYSRQSQILENNAITYYAKPNEYEYGIWYTAPNGKQEMYYQYDSNVYYAVLSVPTYMNYTDKASFLFYPHPYPNGEQFIFNNCISNQTKWEVNQSITTAITNLKEFYIVVDQLNRYFNQTQNINSCPSFTKVGLSNSNYITAEGVNAIYKFLGATYPSRQNKNGEVILQGTEFEKDKDYVSAIMFTTLADRLNNLL